MILERLIVKLSLDDAGYRKDMGRATADLDKFQAAAGSATRIVAGFTAAVVGGTVALVKMAQAGGRVDSVQRAFTNRLQEGTGAIVGLRRETRGLLSDYDLMQQANNALALGSAKNAEQFGELADISIRLGRALGIDTAFALNSLNTGIARQSRLYLDNLGIIISVEEANRKYAEALGRTASSLSDAEQREAFRNEALRQARELVKSFGEQSDTAAESADRLAASVKNIKDRTLELVAASPDVKAFLDLLNQAVTPGAEGGTFAGRLFMGIENVPGIGPTVTLMGELADRAREAAAETAGLKTAIAQLPGIDVSVSGAPSRPMAPLGAGGVFAAAGVEDLLRMQEKLGEEADQLRLDLALEPGVEAARELSDRLDQVLARLRLVNGAVGMFGGVSAARMLAFGRVTGSGPGDRIPPSSVSGITPGSRLDPAIEKTRKMFEDGLVPSGEDAGNALEKAKDGAQSFGDKLLAGIAGGVEGFDLGDALGTAAGNLISAGISKLVGGVIGLFQESPQEAARRRVQENNTRALERLNQGIARLNSSLLGERGGDFAAVQQAVEATLLNLDVKGDIAQGGLTDSLAAQLAKLGLTLEDAERIAGSFGIELDGTVEALFAFHKALQTQFLDQIMNDFSTRFGLLQQSFQLLGTGPEQQLEQTLDALARGGLGETFLADLSQIIAGNADLDTFMEDFFARLLSGDESIFEDLGGLSVEEFIQTLGFLDGALNDLAGEVGKTTDAFRNVPAGFKAALRVFQASDPELPPIPRTDGGGIRPDRPGTDIPTGGGGGGPVFTGPITVVANDPAEFLRKMEEMAVRRGRRGGTQTLALTFDRPGG